MAGLFRPEALDGQRQAWLGSIQLVRPVPLGLLTALVAATAVTVGAYLFEGQYTRKAHVAGYLVPDRGERRIYPQQGGIIAESHVDEGVRVHAGDVLFVVSLDQATPTGNAQAAVQQSLDTRRRSLEAEAKRALELQREQANALERQAADVRTELTQIDEAIDLQREKLALKRKEVAKFESLMKGDAFISETGLQVKRAEAIDVQSHLLELSAQRTQRLRDLGQIEARRRQQPLDSQDAQGDIQRRIATLAGDAAQTEARRATVVVAPADGVVTGVMAQRGDHVLPTSLLASVLPADAKLQAELFAPSSAVGFVRETQQVQLRYEAFPYQKFGHHVGQITQVSRAPLRAAELAALPLPQWMKTASSAEPLYRITVALDAQSVKAYGRPHPLVAGMQLEGDVLLEQRRLIEWIFEPLLSVTGRM